MKLCSKQLSKVLTPMELYMSNLAALICPVMYVWKVIITVNRRVTSETRPMSSVYTSKGARRKWLTASDNIEFPWQNSNSPLLFDVLSHNGMPNRLL
jgi:hypothetical protein